MNANANANFGSGSPRVDEYLRRLARESGRGAAEIEAGGLRVLNDGAGVTRPGFLYGRDESGFVAAATATRGPKWVALTAVGRGREFLAIVQGPALVRMDDPTLTWEVGGPAWLSPYVAGTITPVQPDAGEELWRVGTFKGRRAAADGRVLIDLHVTFEPLVVVGP